MPNPFDTAPIPLSDMSPAAQLELLKRVIGPGVNRNDMGESLIEAAIERGVHDKGAIIDLLLGLGFTHGHVATLLEKGADATTARWRRDGAGRYSLRERG